MDAPHGILGSRARQPPTAGYEHHCSRLFDKFETVAQKMGLLQKVDIELSFKSRGGEEISGCDPEYPAAKRSTESRSDQRTLRSPPYTEVARMQEGSGIEPLASMAKIALLVFRALDSETPSRHISFAKKCWRWRDNDRVSIFYLGQWICIPGFQPVFLSPDSGYYSSLLVRGFWAIVGNEVGDVGRRVGETMFDGKARQGNV
ncbi:hypothetical protein GGX14DRAFT_394174 [Mycena pura]|uniref:Uncharacterized protein n=1 Tax=Mycena pura TaxID=153505 RepID=A0AAD6YI02_9AGAR|nr:hypothetical protein GGX14DRAFT_394174 [Mycena pura]